MKTVLIVGGGFSGISTAISLLKSNIKITLIESSPILGGRAKSFFVKDLKLWLDTGQHILINGYSNTIQLLKEIDALNGFSIQKKFCVKFRDKNFNEWELSYSKSLQDLINLLAFKNISLSEKLSFFSILSKINNYDENNFDKVNVFDFLKSHNQSENLINNFWRLFVESTLNSPIEKSSTKTLLFVIKKMFLEDFRNAKLIIPVNSLYETVFQPAEKFLLEKGIDLLKGRSIIKIVTEGPVVRYVVDNKNEKHYADYFVLAVPYHSYLKLLGKEKNLNFQSIINAQLVFKDNNPKLDFYALWGSEIHWAFFHNTHITLTKSNGEKYINLSDEELKQIFITEFYSYFPEFKSQSPIYFKIIKEKRATFISDLKSLLYRVNNITEFKNLFIAGDFTDTGYPSTIESAVISGRQTALKILDTMY